MSECRTEFESHCRETLSVEERYMARSGDGYLFGGVQTAWLIWSVSWEKSLAAAHSIIADLRHQLAGLGIPTQGETK